MSATAFFDISDPSGGRLYVLDTNTGRMLDDIEVVLNKAFDVDIVEIKGEPGRTEACLLGLPLDMLDFRMVELDIPDVDRVREVLPFELDGLLLKDPSELVIDAVMLGGEEDRYKVLAVYMNKERLGWLLGGLSRAGYEPSAATSLDLAHFLGSRPTGEELVVRLLEGPKAAGDERIDAARDEMRGCTVNLRRGDLSYTKEIEKTKRSLVMAAVLIIAIALVFSGDIGLRIARINKEAVRIEQGIIKTYSGLYPDEKIKGIQGITYRMKSHLQELRKKQEAYSGVSPLKLMMRLKDVRPPDVEFTEVSLDTEIVVLKGEAPSLSEVEQLKSGLDTVLDEVIISSTEQSSSEKIVFTITARERQI
jgi:type II secretory pathway component PulL